MKIERLFAIVFLMLFTLSLTHAKEEKETTKFKCDKKKYCKHMSSCEEAMFLLNECGIKRLDRDKDGVPCESICSGG